MKKVLLVCGMTAAVTASLFCACSSKKNAEPTETMETVPGEEVELTALKQYMPGVDRIAIMQNAENVNLGATASSLVVGDFTSVYVDDTKLNLEEAGTYPVLFGMTKTEDEKGYDYEAYVDVLVLAEDADKDAYINDGYIVILKDGNLATPSESIYPTDMETETVAETGESIETSEAAE